MAPAMLDVAVAKRLGDLRLDIAFTGEAGLVALFGRSGAGKSVTIGLIAGLLRPDRGRVVLNGRVLVDTEQGIFLPPWKRRIGLVFQDSHLLPHLSVRHNLGFGRWFARADGRRVGFEAVVETLGIGALLDRRPGGLSGGERQRVAIGRALLSCPDLLLFDEPFAALDGARKREILPLVERVRDEFGVPIVFVSHVVEEVARLAARVVLIEGGSVAAIGDPTEIFGPTQTSFGDTRFERVSVLTARVAGEDDGLTELRHAAGTLWLAGPTAPAGAEIRVAVKATDVALSVAPAQAGLSMQSALSAEVAAIETDGAVAIVELTLQGGGRLYAAVTRRAASRLGLRRGTPVQALVKTVALDERAFADSVRVSPRSLG